MPLPDTFTEVKVSSDAAETFIKTYYGAINERAALLPFYINNSSRYAIQADISINGTVVQAPADYFQMLESQGKHVKYEVESFDAQVINPSFQYGAPENLQDNNKAEKSGGRMSIVVTTMGKVQFGKGRDAPAKMFNETFVLVPNWEAMVRNPPRNAKRWLIMSQNFRAL